jgi:predicted nuclease of predicted toxin-antitoxin system
MNWLVDAQLPPRLCEWLRIKGDYCIHVPELSNGIQIPDETLWLYAKKENLIIISKDRDFFDFSILRGSPPQILYINVGNCSNDRLLMIMDHVWEEIIKAFAAGNSLVIITQSGIQKF